jgi:type IV pilus assembly protein PilA
MKTEIQIKFIQYLHSKKPSEQGFTLIELLVVIVIVGLLAGIALPSFLGHSVKGKQTEAKIYINSLNKNQQGFYFEKGRFASHIDELGLGRGISTSTINYNYATTNGGTGGTDSYAWSYTSTQPQSAALKNYSGRVSIKDTDASTNEMLNTVTVLCEQKNLNQPAALPLSADNCAADQNRVGDL